VETGSPRRADPVQMGLVGLVARIVEPMAPNFAALRRVSSNAERAYVSTSSPCLMSVYPRATNCRACSPDRSAPAIQPVHRSMRLRASSETSV
jgi:hypothetical protein